MKLSRLALGEQFAVEFDFGDSWMHLCAVGDAKLDPTASLRSRRSPTRL